MSATVEPFAAQVVHLDGSLTLRLTGELDVATVPILEHVVADLLSPHLRAVTIDLGPLTFVDITGLDALSAIIRAATGYGADARLLNVTAFAQRIMHVIGAHELIDAGAPRHVSGGS